MPSLFVHSPLLWNSQDLLYMEIYGIFVAWDFWMASTSRFLSMVTISPSVVISIYAPIVKYFKIRQIVPDSKLYFIVQSSNYVGSNTMYAFVLSSFFYFFLEYLFFKFLLLFLLFLSTLTIGLDLGADLDLRLAVDLSIFVNVL
jgi:hypothetical protein